MAYTLIEVEHYDPTYPLFPILAAFGIFLTLLPAYWHFKSGNIGTIMYMVWTVLGCFIYGLNSILWAGNLKFRGWFWCDLSTKILVGMSVGIGSASLAINRRLYRIATIRQVQVSRRENRKNMWIELALAVGFPILIMILHVISQGHRFDIYENVGCWPSIYVTPVAIATVMIWPIVLGLVSLVYASLSIRAFLKQRKQFSNVLQSANSGLSVSRYFRLMALAATEIVFCVPFATYMLVNNILYGLAPWISWEDTHLRFNRIEYFPFGIFKLWPNVWIAMSISRYVLPAQGFFFFIYLGLSGESGVFYRRQFWKAAQFVGFSKPVDATASASWVARPGASAPSQLRSLPPFPGTTSVTSSTGKKGTPSLDLYPMSSPRAKTNSSSDSLSLPPDFDEVVDHPATTPREQREGVPTVHPSATEVDKDVA